MYLRGIIQVKNSQSIFLKRNEAILYLEQTEKLAF